MENKETQDKDIQRMRELVKSFNNKQEVYKEGREEVNEEEVAKDAARIKKNISAEDVNENFYTQGGLNTGMKSMNTVNSIHSADQGAGAGLNKGSKLRPEEGLSIALFRTLESGAPMNNMGFYDEMNWHLSNLGFSSKLPIDIKEEILKMIKG